MAYAGHTKSHTPHPMTDVSDLVLRFVSDNAWGGPSLCRLAARLVADYLVLAWNHRNAIPVNKSQECVQA